ncbi:MAG: hypothetical protein ABSC20_10465 [Candidatus Bathyarchaeia archaeon]|jgi:hypothetical protein
MLNVAVKRFILPFSPGKSRELFSFDVEASAVYALTELERAKGGGLIVKQHEEKLLFITKIGYPLWLFPNNETGYIFDGLNDSSISVHYFEVSPAKTFIESLEKNSKTHEDYMTFLSDHDSYFQQPKKEKEFVLRGLIAGLDFKKEFSVYRKEAIEVAGQPAKLAPLAPTLEEATISSMLTEMDKLQSFLREDSERLSECLKLINKTTSQYITELDYAAEAVRDEANAKIKAQEEFVTPKITKLNSEYKHQIAQVTRSFNEELESLEKLKEKTVKFIDDNEEKIKRYNREAKTQAQKNHLIYEKTWKEKSRQIKKELDGLKKELKRIENSVKNLKKQKTKKTSTLQLELETEIKLARQPLLDLAAARDAKVFGFKQKTAKLIKQEKPVIDGLNGAIKLAEAGNARFEMLGIREQQLKSPALFYVPFYMACYQAGLTKRYIFLPPSMTSPIGFAAKLKGAFGRSKIKELFIPRFKEITALIDKVQVLTKQDSLLDDEIRDLGEKNNLLNTESIRDNIAKGLVYLKHEGWLSDREYQVLSSSLAYA